MEYVDGKPVRIDAMVVSIQHHDTVTTDELRAKIRKHVIDAVIPQPHGGCAIRSTTSIPRDVS